MIADDLFIGACDEVTNLSSFDAVLGQSDLFRVRKEVTGQYVHALPGENLQAPRIDRILVPTQTAMNAGWTIGPVGVEAKAGGHKVGPALCQAMDYRRAAFSMPGGYDVILRWVFLYPLGKQMGAIASVMAQHRLGFCYWGPRGNLIFSADGRRMCQLGSNPHVGSMPVSGAKRGSR